MLRAVVADRSRRTNLRGTLGSGFFFGCGGLFHEIHVRLVFAVFQKIWRFVHAGVAGDTGVIDVPFSRHVLRLFVCFVGHRSWELLFAVEGTKIKNADKLFGLCEQKFFSAVLELGFGLSNGRRKEN